MKCRQCKKRDAAPGRWCAECRQKKRDRYRRLTAKGKCPFCYEPATQGHSLCDGCREKMREKARARYAGVTA